MIADSQYEFCVFYKEELILNTFDFYDLSPVRKMKSHFAGTKWHKLFNKLMTMHGRNEFVLYEQITEGNFKVQIRKI